MKLIGIILLLITFTSCMEAERNYNRKSWEYKTKLLDLEYLEKLYEVKRDLNYKQEMFKLDSLIRVNKKYN